MSISLISRVGEVPVAFVDVETTGASCDLGDKVIEIGVVRVEGGKIVAEYQQLLDPKRRIGAGITALTGITPGMCAGQPEFRDVVGRISELLGGAVIGGHNVRFDLSFLNGEFRRAGRDMGAEFGNVPVVDTVRMARRRFGRGGNGLQSLAPRLGVFPSVAHRALADAQTTFGVFEKLIEPVGGWGCMVCDVLAAQGGVMGVLPKNPREKILPLELEEALDRRGPVRMEYLDARGARTERVVVPVEVRRRGGELMLIADCRLRGDRRTFKLERIVQLARVEEEEAQGTEGACPPVDGVVVVEAEPDPSSPPLRGCAQDGISRGGREAAREGTHGLASVATTGEGAGDQGAAEGTPMKSAPGEGLIEAPEAPSSSMEQR